MKLTSRVIFSSGIGATGKTTIMKSLAKKIENSLYLDRDDINQGNSYVSPTQTSDLPNFEQYIVNAKIFPDHIRRVKTAFGEMWKVDPHNEFYRRHLRDQSYLVQMYLARTNIQAGKVPIIDCITMRQIQDGTLQKIIDSEFFLNYPKYLIHFICDEKECYQRILARSKIDEAARKRTELIKHSDRNVSPTSSPEAYHKFITEEQPMMPKELKNYKHLLVNTSEKNIDECVMDCLKYVSE